MVNSLENGIGKPNSNSEIMCPFSTNDWRKAMNRSDTIDNL